MISTFSPSQAIWGGTYQTPQLWYSVGVYDTSIAKDLSKDLALRGNNILQELSFDTSRKSSITRTAHAHSDDTLIRTKSLSTCFEEGVD
jgi:hypothetical protein